MVFGKSSILESLNSFFNNKPYLINKGAIADGIYTVGNEPFITPIFLIEKSQVTRSKRFFEKVSKYFWNIDKAELEPGVQNSMKSFFELRESIISEGKTEATHYFMLVGESNLGGATKINFGSFHSDERLVLTLLDKDKDHYKDHLPENKKREFAELKHAFQRELEKKDWTGFIHELKGLYSYVYLPVEMDLESFTKIETEEMQKVFDKKLKGEIRKMLSLVKLDTNEGINSKLQRFVKELETTLNNEYCYDTGMQRNNNVTANDLVDKVIEVYFQKRILYKKDANNHKKKISELSAGEKRQALVDLIYGFLRKEEKRETMVIVGIDEPENSLHTALCYDQFEKLKEISLSNQILITTHWYGFLPIISKGLGHFLSLDTKADTIVFETYDLYDYRAKVKQDIESSKNRIPSSFTLKSTNDLVQAIFYSLKSHSPYNWIIVEGVSEKIYFEYFFQEEIEQKKLRILAVGGQSKVSEIYEHLRLPIDHRYDQVFGKVYCLIDTDGQRHKDNIGDGSDHLVIRRLSNSETHQATQLLTLDNSITSPTDIEQSLDPVIFQKTMSSLGVESKYQINTILNENGNSSFIENFENLKLKTYFKENEGRNKVTFAKAYIEIMIDHPELQTRIPKWIQQIKAFFHPIPQ